MDKIDFLMVRAVGQLTNYLTSYFQRAGIETVQEFSDKLATYATTVGETDPDAATALSYWASMAADAASSLATPVEPPFVQAEINKNQTERQGNRAFPTSRGQRIQ